MYTHIVFVKSVGVQQVVIGRRKDRIKPLSFLLDFLT